MISWKPTRNARALDLADYQERLAEIPSERKALNAEMTEIGENLQELLLNDPARALEAERRKGEIAAELGTLEAREAGLRERIAKLEADAADKAKAAEKAAVDKEAEKLKALVHEIASENAKQAARITKLEEHRVRAAAAGIEDAESRVRRKPARIVPAITQTVTAWFGPDGTRYGSNYTTDDEGRQVKVADRVQREVVDVIRAEYELPGELPNRFAELLPVLREALK